MPRELYERCTICGGSGRIDPARWAGWRHRPRPAADGKVDCPACNGERFVRTGLTMEQVERLLPTTARPKSE